MCLRAIQREKCSSWKQFTVNFSIVLNCRPLSAELVMKHHCTSSVWQSFETNSFCFLSGSFCFSFYAQIKPYSLWIPQNPGLESHIKGWWFPSTYTKPHLVEIPIIVCQWEFWHISRNLQVMESTKFIVKGYNRLIISFPVQIWELMQLRHLKMIRFILPNPLSVSVNNAFLNIQIISYLSPSCCTKEVISGIHNVQKLWVKECYRNYIVLDNLYQHETLSLKRACPSTKALPRMLMKLRFKETYRSWSYLDVIDELPNLEVLKSCI